MIVVTAATGQLGRLVIDRLLDLTSPSNIAAVVRDRNKARDLARAGVEIRLGDYNDPDSLRSAFADAEHLLFISSPEIENDIRIPQHMNVIEAAQEERVGHIAYTSYLGAAEDLPGPLHAHYATERAIEDAGLTFTHLRNPIYTEALLPPEFLRTAVESGELKAATGGHSVNTACRYDLAEAAAVVVSSSGHDNKAYHLTGPLWTFEQLAELLSTLTESEIAFREVPVDEMGPAAWVFALIRSGALEDSTPDLENLIGHPSTPIEKYVRMALRDLW